MCNKCPLCGEKTRDNLSQKNAKLLEELKRRNITIGTMYGTSKLEEMKNKILRKALIVLIKKGGDFKETNMSEHQGQ